MVENEMMPKETHLNSKLREYKPLPSTPNLFHGKKETIFMVAFSADKKATFSPTKRQLTKRLLVAFLSVAFEQGNR